MSTPVDDFIRRHVLNPPGPRKKDSTQSAYSKVIVHLDILNSAEVSKKQRKNSLQSIRRLLGKHPAVITMIKTAGAK